MNFYDIETVTVLSDAFWSVAESCAVCIPSGGIDAWNSHPWGTGCRHAEEEKYIVPSELLIIAGSTAPGWAVKHCETMTILVKQPKLNWESR